jgi:hypothetical protein
VDQPPFELLYSARIGLPSYERTTPAVARTASLVDAGSSSVTPFAV